MPAAPSIAVGLVTTTSALGAVLASTGSTAYAASAGALISAGALALTVVGAAGLLLSHSPWARRVLALVAVTWLALCLTSPLSALSTAVIGTAAVALAVLAGPWLGPWMRRLPATGSPPPILAAVLLALVATPLAAGLARPDGATALLVAWSAWSVLLAVAVGRTAPGSLLTLRMAHPAFGITAGILAGPPAAIVVPIVAAAPASLAWRSDVARSVIGPETTRGTPVPFPPELVPPEILSSAGLDDRGRPLEDRA